MLISSVFVGMLIGLALKGSLLKLSSLRARLWWLLLLAFLAKFMAVKLHGSGLYDMGGLMPYVQGGVYWVSIGFIVLNRRFPWMKVILLGTLLNATVVMMNGGRMPVSEQTLVEVGKVQTIDRLRGGEDVMHSLGDDSTFAPFLGDWITIPPSTSVLSIGDVIVMIGVILLISSVMTSKGTAEGQGTTQESVRDGVGPTPV